MAVPSVALVHRTSKARTSGEAPVWVRITHARRSRFYTGTGVAVKPKDWNDRRKQVRASHDLADAYNAKLDDLVAQARTAALTAPDAEAVVAALAGQGGGSLSGFLDRYIGRLRDADRTWDRKKYETLKAKLSASLGWPLTWADLSPGALSSFDTFLRVEKKNAPNTVVNEFKRLRRICRLAIHEGELETSADPFARFKLPKGATVSRRRLSLDHVDKLIGLGPDDGVPDGSRLAAVRDLFAVQFYAHGARVGDALRFTPETVADGRFTYVMRKTDKTKQAAHSVAIPPPARVLVDRLVSAVSSRDAAATRRFGRFLLPLLKPGDDGDRDGLHRRINSASSVVNRLLKELAVLAELEPAGLSSHTARHSFADFARRTGDVYAVSKALGHADLATTERYLSSFDRDAVDNLTDGLWGTE